MRLASGIARMPVQVCQSFRDLPFSNFLYSLLAVAGSEITQMPPRFSLHIGNATSLYGVSNYADGGSRAFTMFQIPQELVSRHDIATIDSVHVPAELGRA